jgi:hypothetical protein
MGEFLVDLQRKRREVASQRSSLVVGVGRKPLPPRNGKKMQAKRRYQPRMQYDTWVRLYNLGTSVLAIGEIIWRLHELGRKEGRTKFSLSNRPFERGPDLNPKTKMAAIKKLVAAGLIRTHPVRAKQSPVVSIVNVADWEVTFEPAWPVGEQ